MYVKKKLKNKLDIELVFICIAAISIPCLIALIIVAILKLF